VESEEPGKEGALTSNIVGAGAGDSIGVKMISLFQAIGIRA